MVINVISNLVAKEILLEMYGQNMKVSIHVMSVIIKEMGRNNLKLILSQYIWISNILVNIVSIRLLQEVV